MIFIKISWVYLIIEYMMLLMFNMKMIVFFRLCSNKCIEVVFGFVW